MCLYAAYFPFSNNIQLNCRISTFFTDYATAARLEVLNGRIYLVHDGHKFIRYGSSENTRFWRCQQSFRYECKARILTKLLGGREMMKVQIQSHEHKQLKSSTKTMSK